MAVTLYPVLCIRIQIIKCMRINYISFVAALVGMLVYSCADMSDNLFEGQESNLPFKINETLFIPDIVDSIRTTPLHFEEQTYYTIDKMVVRDDFYYLFDYKQKKVMAFDRTGELAFIIVRTGRGPGEYLDMKSATVDAQDIIILDNQMRFIHRYNRFTGEYVTSHRLSFTAWDIEAFNDGTLVFAFVPMPGGQLAQSQPDNMILITNGEGRIRERLLETKNDYYEPMSKDCYLRSDGESIVFSSYGFDGCVMFDCNDSGKREKIMINFGNNTAKDEDRKEWASIVKKHYLHDTPLPCGDMLGLLIGLGDEKLNYFLCNRSGRMGFLHNPSLPQKKMLYMPKASYKGRMYSLIEGEEYVNLVSLGILPPFPSPLEDGDMILAEYSFKSTT